MIKNYLGWAALASLCLSFFTFLFHTHKVKRVFHVGVAISYLIGHTFPVMDACGITTLQVPTPVQIVTRTMVPVFLVGFYAWGNVSHFRNRHKSVYVALFLYMVVSETTHFYIKDVNARVDIDLALFVTLFFILWRRCHTRQMLLLLCLVAIYVCQVLGTVVVLPEMVLLGLESGWPLLLLIASCPAKNANGKVTCWTWCCGHPKTKPIDFDEYTKVPQDTTQTPQNA